MSKLPVQPNSSGPICFAGSLFRRESSEGYPLIPNHYSSHPSSAPLIERNTLESRGIVRIFSFIMLLLGKIRTPEVAFSVIQSIPISMVSRYGLFAQQKSMQTNWNSSIYAPNVAASIKGTRPIGSLGVPEECFNSFRIFAINQAPNSLGERKIGGGRTDRNDAFSLGAILVWHGFSPVRFVQGVLVKHFATMLIIPSSGGAF